MATENKPEAGRELDALVAEKVMGWTWWRSSATGRRGIFAPGVIPRGAYEWFKELADGTEELCRDWGAYLPAYSTDIAMAWRVVEKMNRHRFSIGEFKPGTWKASFSELSPIRPMPCLATAATAPLAICLAALEAVEELAKR
jgi:hypothetical protein